MDDIITTLEGTWRFKLYPNGKNQPAATGQRAYTRLIPNHPSLRFYETFDGRDVVVAGVWGYDADNNQFYEFGVPSAGPTDHLVGDYAPDREAIDWVEARQPNGPSRGTFKLADADHFTYQTDSFRAEFERVK